MAANPCPSPLRLSYYYAGAGLVPAGTIGYPYGVATPIPSSGRIAFSNFHGATYVAPVIPGVRRSMFETYFFGDCVSCYQSDITIIDIIEKGGGTPTPTPTATGFYYTKQTFTATSNQTVFTVTRAAGYISGQCLVFQNGILLDTTEYSDSAGVTGTVTLTVGATSGDIISIMSFRSTSSSGTTTSFTRVTVNLTAATTYTAAGFTLTSGQELLFINGTVISDQAYDIAGQVINNFPSALTGKLTIIQWVSDKPVNTTASTVIGQATYSTTFDANAFNLYNNGALLMAVSDYTTATNSYTLTNTPTTTTNLLLQQAFTRTGAA